VQRAPLPKCDNSATFGLKIGLKPEMRGMAPQSATGIASLRGTNPLQDSLMRLEQAEKLRQQGKLDRAQKICDTLLREHPDYMAALHTLGLIYADKKNYQQALNCLVRAVMLNPHSCSTLTALSGIYLELHASEMAAQTLEQAREINPSDTNVLVTLGEIYRLDREYELAKKAFAEALAIENDLLPAAIGFGWVSLYLGQNAEAVATFEKLLKQGRASLEILAALTYAPPSAVTVDLLAELDKLSAAGAGRNDPISDNAPAFIRATALDKAGRYKEAWNQLGPANQSMFATMQEDLRDSLERQRAVLTRLRANPIKPAAHDSQSPISLFILGPSRSGKTTMEELIGTLEGVKRGYENPCVDNAIRRAFQTAGLLTSSFFEMLPPQLYPSCRDFYLKELARRAEKVKVFTNTHPGRIFDAALIASVFPNVRFVFMKRNLEDTVFRMYQRKYREGNSYAYDLREARDYLAWYYEMIDMIAQKLPNLVRVIRYEDLVTDPQSALRTAAGLCDLANSDQPRPMVGDDRNCSAPYRELMSETLAK
jgi:tetratricopeptide (TPR) repeat protein